MLFIFEVLYKHLVNLNQCTCKVNKHLHCRWRKTQKIQWLIQSHAHHHPQIPSSWLPVPWRTQFTLCGDTPPSLQPCSCRTTCLCEKCGCRLAGEPPVFKAGKFSRTASFHLDHRLQEVESPWNTETHDAGSQTDSPLNSELSKPLPLSLIHFTNYCTVSGQEIPTTQTTETWSLWLPSTDMMQENNFSFTPQAFSEWRETWKELCLARGGTLSLAGDWEKNLNVVIPYDCTFTFLKFKKICYVFFPPSILSPPLFVFLNVRNTRNVKSGADKKPGRYEL